MQGIFSNANGMKLFLINDIPPNKPPLQAYFTLKLPRIRICSIQLTPLSNKKNNSVEKRILT